MIAHSVLLSIAWQTSTEDYLLLLLFLIIAILFFIIFFSWWRGVSDEDLDEIKAVDAEQTSGPATFGEESAAYVIAEDDSLLAEQADHATAEVVEEIEEAQVETAVAQPAAEVEPVTAVELEEPVSVEPDDLKKIEGIGPKIETLLNNDGIQTFVQLADADFEQLKQILTDAGARYKLADPTSWPAQAKLAAAADWDGLNELQDKLKAGRHVD